MFYIEYNIDNINQTVTIYHCNSYTDMNSKQIVEKELYTTCAIDLGLSAIENACNYYQLYKIRIVSKDAQIVIQQTWQIYQYMLNINKKIEVV